MSNEFYDPTTGESRESVDIDEATHWQARGVLQQDTRRRRPLWFDGRFLAARDLTREQHYVLARQSDLGRMIGWGVTAGLVVQASGNTLQVSPGHGITPAGELIAVLTEAEFALDDLPTIERLNATLGLSAAPSHVDRNRTGLFVLAARPVEYTAAPTARYPTTLDGDRGIEDGEIVEAVAFSLVPFDDAPTEDGTERHRARAAHEIFVRGAAGRLSPEVLPLAMLALDRGVLQWLDHYLVRRDAGVENVLGFGLGHRAVREAHLRHYDGHLRQIVDSATGGITAADHFDALPPAGPMPARSITLGETGIDQRFFPPQMDVRMTLVPTDELPALLEDSLALPPIDLTMPDLALEGIRVLVLVPVDRLDLATQVRALTPPNDQADITPVERLGLTAPLRLIRRRPYTELKRLRQQRLSAIEPPVNLDDDVRQAWVNLIEGTEIMWYVRRRTPSHVDGTIGFTRGGEPPVDPYDLGWNIENHSTDYDDGGMSGSMQPVSFTTYYANHAHFQLYDRLLSKFDADLRQNMAITLVPDSFHRSQIAGIGQLYLWCLRALNIGVLPDTDLTALANDSDHSHLRNRFYELLAPIPDNSLQMSDAHGALGSNAWISDEVIDVIQQAALPSRTLYYLGGLGLPERFVQKVDEIRFDPEGDLGQFLDDVRIAVDADDLQGLEDLIVPPPPA